MLRLATVDNSWPPRPSSPRASPSSAERKLESVPVAWPLRTVKKLENSGTWTSSRSSLRLSGLSPSWPSLLNQLMAPPMLPSRVASAEPASTCANGLEPAIRLPSCAPKISPICAAVRSSASGAFGSYTWCDGCHSPVGSPLASRSRSHVTMTGWPVALSVVPYE